MYEVLTLVVKIPCMERVDYHTRLHKEEDGKPRYFPKD